MQHRDNAPNASGLQIAARSHGSETSIAGRTQRGRYSQLNRPSRQNQRQSSHSYHSQRSQGYASDRRILNPYESGSANEHNLRDYGRVLTEERYEQPHQSVGFWDHKLSKVRAHVLILWARTIIVLMLFVFAVLSLYWGVLYDMKGRLRALEVHVVDFDGQVAPYGNVTPIVGPAMTQLTLQMYKSSQPSLGYHNIPPAEYNYDPIAVRRGVYDWHAWAAIIINPNATALLFEAVIIGNASYDPTGAIQYIVQSARQETTTYNYILPQLELITSRFTSQFGANWSRILTNNSFSPQVIARSPAAMNPGIIPLHIDLRPFGPSTATPAVSIGLIYLIIVAFFSFSFFLPIHTKYIQPQGHPPLHFWQLIVWRWLATVVLYLLISLVYSLVSFAFHVPFLPPPAPATDVAFNATAYGRASLVVYWALNFAGMTALGLACENAAMVLGQPWTALWLVFWVITNVSTAFYSLELAPAFFRWGYAWPLHHVVQASRQILFDLRSEVGLHFGVLIAWIAVDTALFPLCCYFMRRRAENEQRDAERSKDRYVVRTTEGDMEMPKRVGDKPPQLRRGFMRGI
ncbi:MNNG and nitrosoguanidine resistance protein [Xylariaceae sp. FL1651]|nr:MNNG and nitrosoguanidine resistance protein [Xylariaceae sp. FL1651]